MAKGLLVHQIFTDMNGDILANLHTGVNTVTRDIWIKQISDYMKWFMNGDNNYISLFVRF